MPHFQFSVEATSILTQGGLYFMLLWRKDRRNQEKMQMEVAYQQREHQKELLELQKRQAEMEMEEKYRNRKLQEEQIRQSMEFQERESAGPGSGGYIIVDLPQDHIPVFNDLLKGFEDYAKIKGYEIRFSSDTTFPNKIAFKFTLGDEGISVSTQTVKKDIQEYIRKVQMGEPLDDLPVILPQNEHHLLITLMKNRINFLQHNYNLKKNAVEFYEQLINKFVAHPAGVLPAPTVLVQTGGNMDSRSYKSIDSSHVIQGDDNTLTDSSIKIGSSFNDRKDQINQLSELIQLLKDEPNGSKDDRDKAILNFEKVKDEISEEEKPDAGRIKKWFSKAQGCLKNIELAKSTIEKAKQLYDSFGIPDLF
jgi:hypothetical protein